MHDRYSGIWEVGGQIGRWKIKSNIKQRKAMDRWREKEVVVLVDMFREKTYCYMHAFGIIIYYFNSKYMTLHSPLFKELCPEVNFNWVTYRFLLVSIFSTSPSVVTRIRATQVTTTCIKSPHHNSREV
jgi:hypothetical protein